MKRLILVRHAKSSWSTPNLPDKERPLNERGRQAAAKIGAWLAERQDQPDQVLSSSATRCRETWERIATTLEPVRDAAFDDTLYLADKTEMLAALQRASGDTVLMLGHMPGIGSFAADLRRDPPPMHGMFDKYPTAATTVLDFNIESWSEAQFGTGKFQAFVTPREIP